MKTTIRYYLTAVRMAIINTIYECWRGYGEKGTSCTDGGNVNWYSHHGEQYGGFLRN